jgi:hypothetical protein
MMTAATLPKGYVSGYSKPEVHKFPARVHCTVQVCELAVSKLHSPPYRSRQVICLTQSPFTFPSNCRCGPPLTSYMLGRAVPSRARHSSTHHRTLRCARLVHLCSKLTTTDATLFHTTISVSQLQYLLFWTVSSVVSLLR